MLVFNLTSMNVIVLELLARNIANMPKLSGTMLADMSALTLLSFL